MSNERQNKPHRLPRRDKFGSRRCIRSCSIVGAGRIGTGTSRFNDGGTASLEGS